MGTRDWGLGAGKHYILSCTPTACGAGEGHEVAIADGTLPQEAIKMAPPSFTICHLPFTIFSGPLPPLSWSPSPRQAVGGKYRGRGMIPLPP